MRVRIPDWGKGLNADVLPSELADGFCSAASNVVFRDGFARQAPGIDPVGGTSTGFPATIIPYWMHQYQTSATTFYQVYANATKAYALSEAAAESEITRYTEGVTVSSATAAGTTVTITTATNHGRTTADVVTLWGFTESAYNASSKSITVTGATTFTYVADSAPSGAATVVGLYSYDGATSNFSSDVGTADTNPKQYSGGVLNGTFIFNSPSDGLYFWAGTGKLKKIPNSYKARVSRPFGNYIFQLAPTIGSTEYPFRVLWSNAAEAGAYPTAFASSATNDAGDVELADTGGALMDCLPLGDTLIIYKTDGRYACQYEGGARVHNFTRLPGTEGLLYRGAVVDTPVGHVFLTPGMEVMLHNGAECRNLSRGRVNTILLESAHLHRSFLTVNFSKSEVLVCFPKNGAAATFCDRILVWNWVDDTWGVKDPASLELTSGTSGIYFSSVIPVTWLGTLNSKLGRISAGEGSTDLNTSFTCYVERIGMTVGEPDALKTLQRSRWNIDGTAATQFSIYHGSSKTADGTVSYATAATYTLGTTDYVSSRATLGKYLATKIQWTSAAGSPRFRSCDLDVILGGKR